ncbi:MAG: MBL fold metallo-hydrolase [Candidatus Neomarinimicrobiota bacterium]|jgi:glyoxylase-like metal-dependent hydrolase (beta-lactamase superfamily II)
MIIKTHVSRTPFQENTYILAKNNEVLIIDPGDRMENILPYINPKDKVLAVLATHGHLDHVSSAKKLCEKFGCPFIINSKDQALLDHLKKSCESYRQEYYGTPKIDIDIADKKALSIGPFDIKILHTPGHSQGGVCFLVDGILFSGDTLFRRSIGNTTFYGGDLETLLNSIKNELFTLADETIVYPGHMGTTTIAEEKKYNPYLNL